MGCTSSAPNMISPKLNTAEKSIQFGGDISDDQSSGVEEILYRADDNDKHEIKVLPSCDTVAEPIDNIVRNISTTSLKSGIDHVNNCLEMEDDSDKTKHDDEKTAKLEEVVDKVVELYKENGHDEKLSTEITEPMEDGKEAQGEVVPEIVEEIILDEAMDEPVSDPEEMLSPSQSESSRATRWEALADIAAELPASLAVDPITGQIYALAK